VGVYEAVALAMVETSMKYHSYLFLYLTKYYESSIRTLYERQFDWGGHLLKSNGGAQRHAQNGWKSFVERKSRSMLNCNTYMWSRYESRV
jgi:hypothetical protein